MNKSSEHMNEKELRDEFGAIDWKANGWPEPNPYHAGDTSTMPYDIWEEWEDICGYAEMVWEEDE